MPIKKNSRKPGNKFFDAQRFKALFVSKQAIALTAVIILLALNISVISAVFSSGERLSDSAFKSSRIVYYDALTDEFMAVKPVSLMGVAEKIENAAQHSANNNKTEEAVQPSEQADKSVIKPKVAIILSGIGISRSATEMALKTPDAISFAVSPYSSFISRIVSGSEASGREYIAEIPVQPGNYPISNAGKLSMLKSNDLKENLKRLQVILERMPDVRMVFFSIDDAFSDSLEHADSVIGALAGMEMNMVVGSPKSFSARSSLHSGMIQADVILDDKLDKQAIQNKLDELVKIAKNQGYAIAVARPYPITISEITNWLEDERSSPVKAVPVSGIFLEASRKSPDNNTESSSTSVGH